jgi:HSP20 family protein
MHRDPRRLTMNKLISYDPFADAAFDDLFRGFFKPVRRATPSPVSVRMDVSENDKGYVVHAEIPGARKEDIQVTIEGNQVTIGAEVKRDVEPKEGEQSTAASRCRSNWTKARARRNSRTACWS